MLAIRYPHPLHNFYDQDNFSDYPYARAGRSRDTMLMCDGVRQCWNEGHTLFSQEQKEQSRLAKVPRTENVQLGRKHRAISQQRAQDQHLHDGNVHTDSVSFYFTNVPHDISYISLRQGFEVCGIMEDVYLARKRNVNGGVFGFVRYRKVKDVEKLLRAINNVWFGDWKVVAKVASFYRFGKVQDVGVKFMRVIKVSMMGLLTIWQQRR